MSFVLTSPSRAPLDAPRRALAVLLVVCAVGCGGSPPQPNPAPATAPPPAEPAPVAAAESPPEPAVFDLPSLAHQAVEIIQAMAAASVAAAGDCGVMAASLQELVEGNAEFFATAQAADKDPKNEAELERLMAPHEERLRTAAESMGSAIAPCANDERMIKVMEGLPL